MSYFDLDQGKLSVRVSEGVYYQLLADMEDFNFCKKNNKTNANAFFNQLLPNLVDYRFKKRKYLRHYFQDNIEFCIKESYRGKLLLFIDDLFDYSYFDDYKENYHNYTFHFRLSKTNIIGLQNFFDELKAQNRNKTTYLRNLFNQYSNMRKDNRESLCFNKELITLKNAILEKHAIICFYKNIAYNLIPYKIDLNYVDGSLYLLALEKDTPRICHAFRLCWLRNIIVKETYEYKFSDKAIKKLNYLIYHYDYTEKATIDLSRLNIKLH